VESFTFAVCGDSRGGKAVYGEILRRAEEDGAAFLVNTGDLVQSGRASEFQAFAELMSDFALPFYPVPGNHDSPDGLLDEFVQYSGAPAAHYSFDYGLGHFVVADSHTGEISSRELDWLEADLAATDRPLKMVFLHHPPFDPPLYARDHPQAFYHYVRVTVNGADISTEVVRIEPSGR